MTSTPTARPVRPGAAARPDGGTPPDRHLTVLLGIILVTQLMVILDATIVTIAMPRIQHVLGFSSTALSWVQNAYALAFGGLLLLGARAGDILGRRRTFVAGIAVFTVASLLGGLAQSAEWLLAARVLQGVGAAVASPAALTLLALNFPEGTARTRALSYYGLVSSGGSSVGLILGGILTDWASWRWGMFINVPIGIALIALAIRYLPETARNHGRFDLGGALTSTLGMSALVYGFTRAGDHGWREAGTVTAFVAGLVLLAGFVAVELRAEQPITPLRLFTSWQRNASFVARLLLIGGMFGMFFFMTQFLQGVKDFSPVRAGVAFLPMTVALFATVQVIPRVLARFGIERLMLIGSTLTVAGAVWLTRLHAGSDYLTGIAGPLLLFGLGVGMTFVPLTSLSLAGVQPADAGAASGLVNVVQQVGGALGLAILVTVFGTATRSAAGHPVPGASAAQQAHHILSNGVTAAFVGSAVFTALTLGVIALAVAPRLRRTAAPAEA